MVTEQQERAGSGRYDVVVVGGGPAGLSAAVTLSRARRSVLVVDAGQPRNAPAGHVHNHLGREGTPPGELLAVGRQEVEGYGGRVVRGDVAAVEPADGPEVGFVVRLEDGSQVLARRLLVATGLVDELPDVPGLAERWGRDVLHCPYCHGWEVRDQPIGVLATSAAGVHQALLFRQLSDDVVLFLHTAAGLADEQAEQLAARGVPVVPGRVAGLEVSDDELTGVRLESGRVVPRRALVVAPRFTARAGVLGGLGLTPTELEIGGVVMGTRVEAGPGGATSVRGVHVAGNVADLHAQVVTSAAAGLAAGAAINGDLMTEDVARAVAGLRAGSDAGAYEDGASEAFWEPLYASRSADPAAVRPNAVLVDVAGPLPAGRALDLGCGEGGDALWLAGRGWHVTAVDVSASVLSRNARRAEQAGVADLVDWQQHDLSRSLPEGTFELVSAQYFQTPVDGFPRDRVLRAAADAVAPGGLLLVVDHGSVAPWSWADPDTRFPTAEQLLASIGLADGQWEPVLLGSPERQATGPGGQTAAVVDTVVAVRRCRREDVGRRPIGQ